MTEANTREKILIHAHELFAVKGYNGASIREISQAADVNIAAINYHFKSKESLFKETLRFSIGKVEHDINEIFKTQSDWEVEDFVLRVYQYFLDNVHDLKTGFKLYIIESEFIPEELNEAQRDVTIGPPGGEALWQCITAHYSKVSEEEAIWAVRTIFTHVIHKALIFSSKCQTVPNKYNLTPQDFVDDIKRLIKIVLNDMKECSD